MTSDTVIRAEGLGKKYIIGHQSADRPNTFRDAISQNVRNFLRGAGEMARGKASVAGDELEEFWALKDVNFEIKRGEVVGIIGRNGAGKSTLLKVLSRITEPSDGRVEIKGRVASLLEVGTGFHPELSGRENIFLNGAILGMTRAEIARKFDEIVDFSGVEKFLDTPVKRYSSGMYVRLAFAVAAHLEPEILIVDEVLAVGDAEFQKKCLGKMQDVAGQGRTVLFVSHNMAAIQAMCKSGILLHQGSVAAGGSVTDVMRTYADAAESASEFSRVKPQLQRLAVTHAKASVEKEIILELTIEAEVTTVCAIEVKILDATGAPVGLASVGGWIPQSMATVEHGTSKRIVKIPTDGLASGRYRLIVALTNPGVEYLDFSPNELEVDFERTLRPGETRALSQSEGHGCMRISAELHSSV